MDFLWSFLHLPHLQQVSGEPFGIHRPCLSKLDKTSWEGQGVLSLVTYEVALMNETVQMNVKSF